MCVCVYVTGVSHRHLSDHLSELVENTLSDLEHSKVGYVVIDWYLFTDSINRLLIEQVG